MDAVKEARLDIERRAGREFFRKHLCERRRCPRCCFVFLALSAAPADAPCLECSPRAPSPRVELTPAAATHSED